jgi:hypothetical protein
MMFQTGNVKTSPGKPKLEPEAGTATLVQATPRPFPEKLAPEEGAGSTMVFGPGVQMDARVPMDTRTPATAVRPPFPAGEPPAEQTNGEGDHEAPAGADDHDAAAAGDRDAPGGADGHADDEPEAEAGATRETASKDLSALAAAEGSGRFDKAPPKGLLIGVGAGLAALAVALAVAVAVKKLGSHPPPPAAVEAISAAQADADKDTLASIGAAESKAKDALDAAGPKARFPDGAATYARIEVQYSDALADQAQQLADRSIRESDDKQRSDAEARSNQLTRTAEDKLKAAFAAVGPALKASPDSAELLLAIADYYRAKRTPSMMNKFIKAAQTKNGDPGRISFIQGVAAQQEDDGAERAIPKLKEAAAANPQSARVHYRLALAYLAMKDEASASAELKTTLTLSPQHERAKATLDALAEHK